VSGASVSWRVLRPSGRWGRRTPISELWAARELVWLLALRDFKLRYRQTLFGIGWAALQPAAGVAIFTVIFGHFAHVPSDGLPYSIFALTALVVWSFVSTAVTNAAESLLEHRALVTEVSLPRILAPIAAVSAALSDLLVGLVLLIPFFIGYGISPPLQALTLPIWLLGGAAVAVAVGLWLSAANVLYRDVRYALGFLLQVWFFVTPVVFPSSLIGGAWRYVLSLNPLTGVIDGLRWALLGAPSPGPWLAVSAGSLAILLVGGFVYFQVAERTFADRI
jgi:lipopolysaccharide transport system permease protein